MHFIITEYILLNKVWKLMRFSEPRALRYTRAPEISSPSQANQPVGRAACRFCKPRERRILVARGCAKRPQGA
ncbi:MAG: hypothetical protein COS94_03745 [Candidatus Hydrogenedentes bacterium CG07_land_8_20_14_0_80_42_17]|nr:MAG: hypothetical protein AUJ18_01600 [Candidatus Hydrogenedentes bacterium CG1_02_42_14]PIU48123.1 MAG: hypothetical protein COS94_03745 [Candidatus Hydrogenedentes bacterium CG07_land_8_20_14_0_80_42_17]